MSSQTNVTEVHSIYDTILILDFGSQYSHLITRRVREFGVYCEMLPCTQKIKELHFKPKGIILSGSPYSVYDEDAPRVDPDVFTLGIPVLGICYGLQEIAWNHSGSVVACNHREYGHAMLSVIKHADHPVVDRLFDGFDGDIEVWMSHGDQLSKLPTNFRIIGSTQTAPFAAIAHEEKLLFGIQFHPEVTHTPRGKEIIGNFVKSICECKTDWTMACYNNTKLGVGDLCIESFIDKEIERIRQIVGKDGEVVGAVSGGVDSTVAAKLMKEAIGDRFHAILVDNGVMRLNECATVHSYLHSHLKINLRVVDASDKFLSRLKGVTDPEKKRKIIGNTFIEVFEEEAAKIDEVTKKSGRKSIEYLLQGTLYPDVIESVSFKGPSAVIKTHHNVGGLLQDMKLKLIEPLRELFKGTCETMCLMVSLLANVAAALLHSWFSSNSITFGHALASSHLPICQKDEVRKLGKVLSLPDDLIYRHPFPGPGIAIRILGEVTPEQVAIARAADHIYIEEIKKAGLYREIAQAYAALLPVKAVGVMGDKRTYEQVIVLRAVETTDFMTADWYDFPRAILKKISNKIINEVKGVNRVVYDISSKPPATIEWYLFCLFLIQKSLEG
ncbi:6046_t:CDS:2 [Paraglomus occultum]|uniref:GMP synthase [glutamine-hydrolyzing] n=1 Tax=Paraglomus occultum TaxID=144539 RepID=A0A9N9C1A0_9GLOM|nr:6046_t:CDS:2 [Paraglomus occultum]